MDGKTTMTTEDQRETNGREERSERKRKREQNSPFFWSSSEREKQVEKVGTAETAAAAGPQDLISGGREPGLTRLPTRPTNGLQECQYLTGQKASTHYPSSFLHSILRSITIHSYKFISVYEYIFF